MSDRMSTLLRDAAPRPAGQLDTTALYRRATRRRRTRQGLSATAIVVALAIAVPLAWPGARPGGPVIGDGQTNTPAPGTTVPTQEELLAPYQELFRDLPRPDGDPLVGGDARVEGLGVIVQPDATVEVRPPNIRPDGNGEVQLTVFDAATNDVLVNHGNRGDRPVMGPQQVTLGPAGSRYYVHFDVIEDGRVTERVTDAVVVAEPLVDVDLVLTDLPLDDHGTDAPRLGYSLVNRGTVGLQYGAGHQLYWIGASSWSAFDPGPAPAIGYQLPPGSISDPKVVALPDSFGVFRIVDEASWREEGQVAKHVTVALTFATDGAAPLLARPDPSTEGIRGMIEVGKNVSMRFLPSDDSVTKLGEANAFIRFDTTIDPPVRCATTGEQVPDWTPASGDIVEIPSPYGIEESMPPTLVPSEVLVDC